MNALVIAWLIAAVCFVGALIEQPILRWWERRQRRKQPTMRDQVRSMTETMRRLSEQIGRDDDGHLLAGVAWGLAAEGLVAAVVRAVLR